MSLTTTFSSQQLSPPRLRFDYALRIQVSDTPFDGFRRWGPYDKNQPRKVQIRCVVIYPRWAVREARKLREAFQNGMFFFKGFHVFTRGISITGFDEMPLELQQSSSLSEQSRVYFETAEQVGKSAEWDLVFAVIPFTPRYQYDSPYYAVKLALSAFGIPCQLLTVEKLQSDQVFKWSLANIALQVYAKLGNVPWVVETPDSPNDLILGVGRREVRSGRIGPSRRYMGFTTAYKNNGSFLSFNGITPTFSEDDYCQQLSKTVSCALASYRTIQAKQNLPPGDPDRIVFHSFKKISANEIDALETGIRDGSQAHSLIPYVLLHIDSSSNFMLFDGDHKSYLPLSGYSVTLGPLQRLLLTEGRERYERRKVGFPLPFVIRLDPRSRLTAEDPVQAFSPLVEQAYGLSKVNWRGFNAAAIPITLGYSRLIADVIASCPDPDFWARITAAENLKNKVWFL